MPQVIHLQTRKNMPVKKRKSEWLRNKDLAEIWNVSPAQITRLAKREHDPLPSDTALGPRRYEWSQVVAWRKRQNFIIKNSHKHSHKHTHDA
ncbi:hypothetical protein [Lactiplantibacillus plantarum]|uniref:hypothetical protein n=1 Tax=Lactiplantibacillus plantarum TaxID=1590 RepID=UPI002165881E|nr:hypothetical protein [Lactiplantibacillus plantarum]UVW04672.1 hypothetical protein NX849_08115 [Lactiplantibacillus plantarum]UWF34844.1 hypothetical protein NYR24_08105 [Lactiplantibacillus plantarum]